MAAIQKKPELIKSIFEKSPKIKVDERWEKPQKMPGVDESLTPLQSTTNLECAKILVEHGASIEGQVFFFFFFFLFF